MEPLPAVSPDVDSPDVEIPVTVEIAVMLGVSRFRPRVAPAVLIACLSWWLFKLVASFDTVPMNVSDTPDSKVISTDERRVVSAAEEVPEHPALNW